MNLLFLNKLKSLWDSLLALLKNWAISVHLKLKADGTLKVNNLVFLTVLVLILIVLYLLLHG